MATTSKQQLHVRVGVGVLVKDPRDRTKIFAGIRKGSHGSGTLALPGGHLDMFESWEDCAIREVQEEMGIAIHHVQWGHVTNDIMMIEPNAKKHYVTIFMMAECVDEDARPRNMEPEKCEGWESFSWSQLLLAIQEYGSSSHPQLFGPLQKLVEEAPPAVIAFMAKE
jgi:8-oxo-dGTP diphosphatase